MREAMFETLYSTAIDAEGLAKEHSLRAIEVAIPMLLESTLQMEAMAVETDLRQQQQRWLELPDPWDAVAGGAATD